MGILKSIINGLSKVGEAVWIAISYPFYLIDKGLNMAADAGERLRGYFPFEHKPPKEKIKAALRKQWLDLAPGEKDIPGVEWEGEIYFETPK